MDTVLFLAYAGAHLTLLAWGLVHARRQRWSTSVAIVLLVAAGLLYDNVVVGSGRFLGPGVALESLNLARYWLHASLTPLLVVFAWGTLMRAGVGWARTRRARYGAYALTAALVAAEIGLVIVPLDLSPQREHGVLTYGDTAGGGGPPLMPLVVSAVLLWTAVVVWRRQRWPWYFVGAALMVVGAAVQLPIDSAAVTNAFELVLLTALLATNHHQDRMERYDAATPRG